jgi:hypothetical protein
MGEPMDGVVGVEVRLSSVKGEVLGEGVGGPPAGGVVGETFDEGVGGGEEGLGCGSQKRTPQRCVPTWG